MADSGFDKKVGIDIILNLHYISNIRRNTYDAKDFENSNRNLKFLKILKRYK